MKIPVDEFTTPAPYQVGVSEPISVVRQLMHQTGIRHLPVVENNKPVGIISSRDIALMEMLGPYDDMLAKDVMHSDPFTVVSGSTLETAALEMSSRKIGSAIVVDDEGCLVGIFTSTDALNALVEILRDDDTIRGYNIENEAGRPGI